MISEKISAMASELKEAASMEGTEIGETWGLLALIAESLQTDYVSEELVSAVEKEIEMCYADLKENFRIVEEEVTTTLTKKIRTLECLG